MKCKEDEDVSEYVTHFKKIYKKVDPYKSISSKTIIRKFINSLPSKFVKLFTIISLASLNKAIEAVLNIEASQKVKVRKRNQVYMVDIIEELHQEVYNLQVRQVKLKQSKPVTSAEPLQETRNQIMPFRSRKDYKG